MTLVFLLSFLISPDFHARSQTPAPIQNPQQPGGTFRIRVGLVQVDMTVFDKQGNFVGDLKPEQIELQVDGEPQPISFLELIATAGPPTERVLAKSKTKRTSIERLPAPSHPDRGRTLLFFIDDWHLSMESTQRLRAALSDLIDGVMGPNDQAAVFTASRQIGFLQQITDSKSVVKLALTRLAFTNEMVRDLSRPPMNEAQALAIEQGDTSLREWFIEQTISTEGLDIVIQRDPDMSIAAFMEMARNMLRDGRAMAEVIVNFRVAGLATASALMTARSLNELQRVVQSCAALPGRKVIFFLSDGFVLQQQRDDVTSRLKQVTDAALRAGVVIHSLDTRGLMAGRIDIGTPRSLVMENPGATSDADFYSVSSTGPMLQSFSDVLAFQDGLNALASDTGGRFIKNTNAFDEAILESLDETSQYYLLGWYAEPGTQKTGRYSRIKVAIKNRPDLKVELRQKSLDLSKLFSEEKNRADLATPSKASDKELAMALQHPWPIEGLPVALYSGFVYNPAEKEHVLGIWVDLEGADQAEESREDARMGILGIVANRDGIKIDAFQNNPSEPATSKKQPATPSHRLTYSRLLAVDPGLYQVRVAAHIPQIHRLGSAHQWVDVSLPSSGKMQLGSIFLKRETPVDGRAGFHPDNFNEQDVSARRRYSAGCRLPFIIQVFNRTGAAVSMEARIYQGNQMVLRTDAQTVATAPPESMSPLFIGGDLPTEKLAAGSYVLEVAAKDPAQNTTETQRIQFWIE